MKYQMTRELRERLLALRHMQYGAPLHEEKLKQALELVERCPISDKPFALDINLDDEQEAREFWAQYGGKTPPQLAKLLGFQGKGSLLLAKSLQNFSINRITAFDLRKGGKIAIAYRYEAICDSIYRQNIQPVCDCW